MGQKAYNCNQNIWPQEGCPTPRFVQYMDPSLFSQIQGVVPSDDSQSDDNYLILFDIRNVLKYCFTAETEVWHNFDFEFN